MLEIHSAYKRTSASGGLPEADLEASRNLLLALSVSIRYSRHNRETATSSLSRTSGISSMMRT